MCTVEKFGPYENHKIVCTHKSMDLGFNLQENHKLVCTLK